MTSEQMQYFFRACVSVEAEAINRHAFANGLLHASKEDAKKANMQLDKMKNSLFVYLLKEDING